MPDPKVLTINGKQYIEAPGMDPIPVEDMHNDNPQTTFGDRVARFTKGALPEISAGLMDALSFSNPLVGAVAPPVFAALTDAGQQYSEKGKVDWPEVAMRGATNVVPDLGDRFGKAVVEGGDAAGKAAMGALTRGPKGGILAGLKSMLGLQSAAPVATAAANDLAKMTLADGTRVLSSDGLKQLVQKSVDLSNTRGTPPAQIQALDALIRQVQDALKPTNLSAADLLSKVGMPNSTTDAIANAAQVATRRAMASKYGRNVRYGLRTALGLTQGVLANEDQ